MFNNCQEAISYIEKQRTKHTFLQFQQILAQYQVPLTLPYTIHIAGTNGKGSTVEYIKEILMAHGLRVGTFTSPYMIIHNDRICINGEPISEEDLLYWITYLYPMIEKEDLSMFEIDVIIMLLYFSTQELDYCIIEAGIGGLQDKTNVINSHVSVITNISYDHQELLGNSLEDITKQKAGIIKRNQACFTTEIEPKLRTIMQEVCNKNNSILQVVETSDALNIEYHGNVYRIMNPAKYLRDNATLAIAVVSHCMDCIPNKVQAGLDAFCYPGRFERIGDVYLDGAHNVAAMQALVTTIKENQFANVGIIFSALQEKEIEEMLAILEAYPVLLSSFNDPRSKMENATHFSIQLEKARRMYDTIIVTGSLHFVSEVRKYLIGSKKSISI